MTTPNKRQRDVDERYQDDVSNAVDQAGRNIVDEKGPDDICFEGGNCDVTGYAQAIAGDLKTLAARDNPDDLEGEPFRL